MSVPLSPAAVRFVGRTLIDPLVRSWRFRTRNHHRLQSLVDRGQPFIFLLWHEAWLPLLWQHRKQQIAIVVSGGRDGRFLSDYARRIGYHPVPGSSSRGGARALLGAIRALDEGFRVAFTPDGPRGPRREIKPGAVRAAQKAGAMILPIHAVTHAAWRLGSWDRMVVPKPFAQVEIGYGEPFSVESGADGLAAGMAQCAAALHRVERDLTS